MPRTQDTAKRFLLRDFGTSLKFTGQAASADRVALPLSSLLDISTKTSFTFSVWAKVLGIGGNSAGRIVDKNSDVGPLGYRFRLSAVSGNLFQITAEVRTQTTTAIATTTTIYPLGQWLMLTFTYNEDGDKKIKIYVDGALAALSVNTAGVGVLGDDSALATTIGAQVTAASGFNGYLDEPRFFATALNITQINALYYSSVIPTKVLELLFNEGSGSTAIDTSGNALNGTITGATYSSDVVNKLRAAVSNRVPALFRLPESPQIVDTFTKTDSNTSLGVTEVGSLTWQAIGSAVYGIASNKAKPVSGSGNSPVYVDVGSPNVDVSVTIDTYDGGSNEEAIYFRLADANNWFRFVRSGGTILLQKNIASSVSTIISKAMTFNNGDVFKISCRGNNIQCFINDALVLSHVTTENNANTKHGFGQATANTAARFDNFQISIVTP